MHHHLSSSIMLLDLRRLQYIAAMRYEDKDADIRELLDKSLRACIAGGFIERVSSSSSSFVWVNFPRWHEQQRRLMTNFRPVRFIPSASTIEDGICLTAFYLIHSSAPLLVSVLAASFLLG